MTPSSGDVEPWGRWSTFGLGLIALLIGQMIALLALTWLYGTGLAHLPKLSGNGVAVSLVKPGVVRGLALLFQTHRKARP